MGTRSFKYLSILILLVSFIGCAAKTVSVLESAQDDPITKRSVDFADQCDKTPADIVQHILSRTDEFCKEEGLPGVARVTVCYIAVEQATAVMYLCQGEE